MKKSYKIFLNILITVLIIAGIGVLGYLGYDYISNLILTKEAEEAVEAFEQEVKENASIVVEIVDNNDNEQVTNNITNTDASSNTTSKASTSTSKYKNYTIVGSIRIPKTKKKYPVVDVITPDAVAVAVTQIYGPGLNKVRKYSFSCS